MRAGGGEHRKNGKRRVRSVVKMEVAIREQAGIESRRAEGEEGRER